MRLILLTLIVLAAAILFYQVVWLRLQVWIQGRRPMTYKKAWVVDNAFRARYVPTYLDWCDLQPGETVLDLGCGPGAFVVEASRRLGPKGRLVAVDVQPEMIELTKKKIAEFELDNVETRVGDAGDLPLADDTIDHAYLVTVLTEIPDRSRALAELKRVLKPGAFLSVMEEFGDPDWVRAKTSIGWIEAAGFELDAQNGTWFKYHLRFRAPDDPAADACDGDGDDAAQDAPNEAAHDAPDAEAPETDS